MITSRRTSPWPADHPPGRPGPERPHRPHQPHSCRLHRPGAGDVSARNAASVSGAARVGETLHDRATRSLPTPTRCATPPSPAGASRMTGPPKAGIPDATGTTCSRSDEDDGASINARVPFPDHRDRQETPSCGPVAYPMGPRQAPQDPQVEAGYPALSKTWPPPVAGDRAPVLRYIGRNRTDSDPGRRGESAWKRTAPTALSPALRSCNCAYDIPKFTTARSGTG